MKAPRWFVCVLALLPSLGLAASETQSFDSEASAAAAGWASQNANANGNAYGFSATNSAGGTSAGEAGGTIVRAGVVSYYADLSIGGPYSRATALSASGVLVVTSISKSPPYNGALTVGHFNHLTPSNAQIGFSFAEDDSGSLRFSASLVTPENSPLQGNILVLTHLLNEPRHWSYTWDPTGGTDGTGRLTVTIDGVGGGTSMVDLPAADAGTALTVDAFGITSPALSNPDANKEVTVFIDDVSYTEADAVPVAPRPFYVVLILMLCSLGAWNIRRGKRVTRAAD